MSLIVVTISKLHNIECIMDSCAKGGNAEYMLEGSKPLPRKKALVCMI